MRIEELVDLFSAQWQASGSPPELSAFAETLDDLSALGDLLYLLVRLDVRHRGRLLLLRDDYLQKFPEHADDIQRAIIEMGYVATQIRRYFIMAEIAQGGTACVYRARDPIFGRPVAVKVLKWDGACGPQPEIAMRKFSQELQTMGKVKYHPNLVLALDGGFDPPHVVMELIDGPTLRQLVLDEGPLDVARAVRYVWQAAQGLAHLHTCECLHLDVKPSNLMLSPEDLVKIVDIGIAFLATEIAGETNPTRLRLWATADYMAPEVAETPEAVGPGADIYSLGCTLWWLLVGEVVYPRDTADATISAHRHADPPSLGARRPEVPEGLDGTFQKMIAKRPEQRHKDMAELLADLAPYVPEARV